MFEILGTPHFWVGLLEIIGVNILLSGDNAVVIALAARSLPTGQRKRAVLFGSIAAIAMRIVLTVVAAECPDAALSEDAWRGRAAVDRRPTLAPRCKIKISHAPTGRTLFAAIRTILLADLVMSLDNVIAVAAAAEGDLVC